MSRRRLIALSVAVLGTVAPLLSAGPAQAAAPEATLAGPTTGHPSVYTWTGSVLQSPDAASGVASPTSPTDCATAATGLCQDVPITVPAGLQTSTLYVRIAWRHPVWKAYLYVTSPDGKTVYPGTAPAASTAVTCDQSLFDKGCGNETSLPLDEVTIPNPAEGKWMLRIAAVNIHDEAYTGMVSLTNSSPLQLAKESLAKLTAHLTRSQRINVVFAGWKPSDTEMADLKANLPDEYIPSSAAKQGADSDDARDTASAQVSGLVQHAPAHYTGTDPTASTVLPNAVFANWAPYFQPLKFKFDYHFLAADDTYTKDLFSAAKQATTQSYNPGPSGVYATSLHLPQNFKQDYLAKYNAKFGHYRDPSKLVTDTQTWDLVDAFTVEDWIQNSRLDSKYGQSFTDLASGKKSDGSFINFDPTAVRDPHWNGNGTHPVNVDVQPQGTEQGVTFMLMDTYSPAYSTDYFRGDHYHYWGSFKHITDPDTGADFQIDDARGWGGRYRFYFQDLGSAPSFYERENWLREEIVAQDGSAGFDPPIWQWRNDPTWGPGAAPLPPDPNGITRAGGNVLGQVLGWDINQGIAFKYIGSYLYRPVPYDYYILATSNWIDHYSQPANGGLYAIDFNKLYKANLGLDALSSAEPYVNFTSSVPSAPKLAVPQLLGCADSHHQVTYVGPTSLPVKAPSADPGCTTPDPRQQAIEDAKNHGALGFGNDLGVNSKDLRNYIDHNRAQYAPLYDGAFTVPVLNIYFEKVYNVAIPLIVGGIAEGTNDGDGWGQIDNLNERSVSKQAIDCANSAPGAPACTGAGPFSNARGMTYTVQHESAHFLGLHHPHDGTASVEYTTTPVPDGSPFTPGSNWHYYYSMNKWQYDLTASPTTYGHTYGTYEVVDQDRLLYGRTSEYLKQAQDWLADAYLLEGAAGNLAPDAALLSRQTSVTADRNQASTLFQCGDYLHSEYAMRNAMLHAKGSSFAAVAPHQMGPADAAAAAAQPTDSNISDGHALFAINPQTVYGPMSATCNAGLAPTNPGGQPNNLPGAGTIGLPNTAGVVAGSGSNTGLLALAGVGLLGAGLAVGRRRRRAA